MVNLFINYYIDKNKERHLELMQCFLKNRLNPAIDKIYVFIEKENYLVVPERTVNPKIQWVLTTIIQSNRPTFTDYFELINSVTGPDDINIVANTDIYFDEENIELIKANIQKGQCYALSRWDVSADGTHKLFDRPDTADTWVFVGKIKDIKNCNFCLGIPGCDNSIAYKLQKEYRVENPSKSIKSFHLHLSGVRNYLGTKERILPPYYLMYPHFLNHGCFAKIVGEVKDNWIEKIKDIKVKGESQFDEEGIIDFIFQNIGIEHHWFADFGAGAYDGKMSNTRKLKQDGWFGFGVDMSPTEDPWIIKEFIKPDNACSILKSMAAPVDLDFLNLDIDSCDFYVLQNILKEYKPRLICTEFNGTLEPEQSLVLEYEEGYTWDKTNKYGYSFAAGKKLLEENGYVIIFNQHDTNIFAIRKELAPENFTEVTAKRNIYHPINQNAKWIQY